MSIFSEYLHKFMAIFVDDFMVYSKADKHIECLRLMFEKCREKRVCLNPYKCVFEAYKGMLLGHIVSQEGIEMAGDKVRAILEAKAPTNANEVSSFLGYVNFYRRFVKKLAELAAPMYALTKKEVTFNWDEKCQEAFEEIKRLVSEKPILRQPNWNQIFHVHVDASNLAIGRIWIFQYIMRAGDFPRQRRPTLRLSKKPWELHLINKVVIQGRLFRWMLLLQEFDFKVIHRPRKRHFGADFFI